MNSGNGGLERLISSHVEVRKIGRQIAEEVLDLQRRCEDSSSGSSPDSGPEPVLFNTEVNKEKNNLKLFLKINTLKKIFHKNDFIFFSSLATDCSHSIARKESRSFSIWNWK